MNRRWRRVEISRLCLVRWEPTAQDEEQERLLADQIASRLVKLKTD